MSGGDDRRPLVCGNWKMHCTVAEATALAADVRRLVASARQVDVVIAPPFTALHAVARRLEGSNVALAAQAMHSAGKGAHTGEISAAMLAEVGCHHVIIGRQGIGSQAQGVFDKLTRNLVKPAHRTATWP